MEKTTAGNNATSQQPYLRITDLTKKFGAFTALDKISLEIFDGEFVCFLGPSGCGKTTLLRAIAGLDIQTYGRIEQGGQDISALPPTERDFGIVFQSYALFPNMTVSKNIAYGLENRNAGKKEIAQRVEELLELVGLPEQAQKYPAQLSGGQQQRIALARALATSPGLLLLDEPLSALDAKVRVHLRHEIRSLQERLDVTTVMVTHDQEEALTMADRIVIMNDGIIEQVGTPLEVYREPETVFVADFIGTMNFISGTIDGVQTVAVGGQSLRCNTDGLASGSQVTVAVRPEDIVVHEVEGEHENIFNVVVAEVEFLGSFVRADLVADQFGDNRMRADFSINLIRRLNIEEGANISVLIPAERIRVYSGNP
ncbi:MAG: putative 2-aminoethylphosphonate ABC transporter ATP-binding protein [Arenicellales bacterium]|nr:putative 2-aminoethylphosphonate ABC transporter ATP-binding protein [Arenicellales bacterium]